MRPFRLSALVVASVLGSGCGAGLLDPNRYDRTCNAASDCVAVSFAPACNTGCGPGPNGAINRSSLAQLEKDTQDATALCGPQFAECLLGGGPPVITTCDSGACGIEPAPVPPTDVSWSWSNPIAATTIPTNTVFAGTVSAGTDPAQGLSVTLTVEGEDDPRSVTITTDTARCAAFGGCESVLDVGPPLPPHANIEFNFTPSSSFSDIAWTTGDGDDVTAPSVVPFEVTATGVAKANGVLEKVVNLRAQLPADDSGLATIDVFRTIDGGEEKALDRLRPDSLEVGDQIPSASGAETACYVLAASDWAGNTARADPVCVDVGVSDAEAASLNGGCASSTDTAPLAAAALLALLPRRRRRR